MRKLLTFLFLLLLLAVAIPTAFAHTTTEVGEYSLITGWQVEPAVVGERNTIYVDVWQDGAEVPYPDMRLNAAFVFGDQRKPIRLVQGSDKGRYLITFIPTAAGEYKIHLFGSIGDDAIDVEVAPESVGEATIIQFPAGVLSGAALQDGLIGLEDQMATLRTMATAGIATGVVGIATALFAMRKKGSE